ncbi:MAG: hypothetical protein EOP04_32275 [Proteobacteria bacterium]|nr:MAG: hypothetical protein EOP04_32275 [Pseudomonadota bacterium]
MKYLEICITLYCALNFVACQSTLNTDSASPNAVQASPSVPYSLVDSETNDVAPTGAQLALAIQNVRDLSQESELGAHEKEVILNLLSQANLFIGLANNKSSEEQPAKRDAYLYLAEFVSDSASKLLNPEVARTVMTTVGPGAVIRDFYEASTGRSIVNGTPLSRVDRSVALLSFATGGVASSVFRNMSTSDRIGGLGDMLGRAAAESGESSEEWDRIVETTDAIFKNVDSLRTKLAAERDSRFRSTADFLRSDVMRERLKRLEQTTTRILSR